MSGTALQPRKATDYALQIAHGLSAGHEKGIGHRDLKPENVFITHDGRLKILDFGLAKLTERVSDIEGQTDVLTRRVNTDRGAVMGTVGYMSPEQVRGLSWRTAGRQSALFYMCAFVRVLGNLKLKEAAAMKELLSELKDVLLKLKHSSASVQV